MWLTEFIPERVPSMDKKETARECKFVVHIPSRSSDTHDVHLIKEQIHCQLPSPEGPGLQKPN